MHLKYLKWPFVTLLLSVAGLILGWTLSGSQMNHVLERKSSWSFIDPGASQSKEKLYLEAQQQLITAKMLGEKKAVTADNTLGSVDGRGGLNAIISVPPTPKVIGVTLGKNGMQAHIHFEGEVISAKEGQTMSNGWIIEAVDFKEVVASFGETETTISLVQYPQDTEPEIQEP